MKAMKALFGNWWVLSVLVALLAVVILAVALPIIAPVLRPLAWRLGFVLLVALAWGGLAAWRVIAARRASDQIAASLAARDGLGRDEANQVAERMRKAMETLKSSGGKQRDYLYSRPWYVIIGPPGAGKSTALQNSGLKFPFSDVVLKGVGGTRNLDFWFADEAVLVDTAGRYATQDSGQDDREGWTSFLNILAKNRPLAPLNGVLIAIGIDTLLSSDAASVERHAVTIRRRLVELRESLGAEIPVYLLFTKMDLLAGFSEFFADLDPEGRRSVLGSTFPSGLDVDQNELVSSFDDVLQAIMDRSAKRLQDELDGRRRSLILGFPGQFAGMRARVQHFLQAIFPQNAQEGRALLRGFYFTSGVQQGTPLDLLLQGVASVQNAPQPAPSGPGRAYFINRLITEVVLGEAGLAAATPEVRRRRAVRLAMAIGGIAAVSILVLIAWTTSFIANRRLQDQMVVSAHAVRDQIHNVGLDLAEVRDTDIGLEDSLPVLDALRALPRGYAERIKGGPPILETFGLYQSGLSQKAARTYLETTERVLSPRILLRLERFQHDHGEDPIALYEPLKVYLLLGGQHPLEPKAVTSWVTHDWETDSLAGEDRADVRKRLGDHLAALMAAPGLGHVWPDRVAPLDADLISASRLKIEALPLTDRAYAILRQKVSASGLPDWRLAEILPAGEIQAFQSPDAVAQLTTPAFFTKRGFTEVYQPGLQTVQSDLQHDLWVMGEDQDKEGVQAQIHDLKQGVANRYAADYVAAWNAVLSGLKPGDYFNNATAASAILTQPSPIKVVLQQVRQQTSFGGGSSQGPGGALQQKLSSLSAAESAAGSDASKQISGAFTPLGTFVDGQFDDFLSKLKQALEAKALLDRASGPDADAARAQFDQAMAALQVAGAGAPDDLKPFVAQASKQGDAAGAAAIGGAEARAYGPVLADCLGATTGRYPFVRASQNDAAVGDMLRVFGPGSSIENFRVRIQSYLDMGGSAWRWRTDDPTAASFDPGSAQQFQRASQIRDLLAAGIPFQIQADGFGPGVASAELSIGGNVVRFQPGQSDRRAYQWSPQGLQEARLVLEVGGKNETVVSATGPWAAFRLFDAARLENAGPTAFKATFGAGTETVSYRVTLTSEVNPFSRGGPFLFHCPARL
jgi:type VI secretion system protein ImpL